MRSTTDRCTLDVEVRRACSCLWTTRTASSSPPIRPNSVESSSPIGASRDAGRIETVFNLVALWLWSRSWTWGGRRYSRRTIEGWLYEWRAQGFGALERQSRRDKACPRRSRHRQPRRSSSCVCNNPALPSAHWFASWSKACDRSDRNGHR